MGAIEQTPSGLGLSQGDIYETSPSTILVISESQLRVFLMEAERCRVNKNAWITPLGIAVSCWGAFCSLSPNTVLLRWDKLGVDANSFFLLASFASTIWTIVSFIRLCGNKKKGTTDEIISRIRETEQEKE